MPIPVKTRTEIDQKPPLHKKTLVINSATASSKLYIKYNDKEKGTNYGYYNKDNSDDHNNYDGNRMKTIYNVTVIPLPDTLGPCTNLIFKSLKKTTSNFRICYLMLIIAKLIFYQ